MLDDNDLTAQLRRVLRDCRKLYANSARQLSRRHPHLLEGPPQRFVELMDDLHRGLIVKVYTTVVRSDGQWSRMEKFVGSLLIEHLWDQRLKGAALREAAENLLEQADHLQWETLVGPFVRFEPLRDSISHVETVVMRLANLVAKCDGLTTPEETLTLHTLQQDIDLALRGNVAADPSPDAVTAGAGAGMPGNSSAAGTSATAGNSATAGGAGVAGRSGVAGSPASVGQAESSPLAEVVEAEPLSAEQQLHNALEELEQLIGLEEVKDRVRSLSNYLRLQREREQAGFPTMPISLHMAFVGNPGTGKTTVARIVGQVLGAMGVLESGHLVETDRSGLVAEYAGQTSVKTNKLCDAARNGVLFIDEAYSLVDASGDDPFGREALQTLLKRMEDDRDSLVVILAGYPDEMDAMIRSNPGLSSRINHRLKFDDYGPADLGRIFECLCEANKYRLPASSRFRLLVGLDELHRERDRHFGNGRLARNAFENCVRRLADRIASIVPLTPQLLCELTPADITVPGLSDERLEQLQSESLTLRVSCPKCGKRLKTSGRLLGRLIRCPKCQHPFQSPWADVERV
ncbi:AAA family ATPase [Roseimaritima sediminicola]|uniref:AAA family ATPase n=1 Tax=Roseimaritima sediminicola TaxID=2662066 RepID=UPI00129831AB|nr:AAA family ATPase [Roseimaritima sediminicola]